MNNQDRNEYQFFEQNQKDEISSQNSQKGKKNYYKNIQRNNQLDDKSNNTNMDNYMNSQNFRKNQNKKNFPEKIKIRKIFLLFKEKIQMKNLRILKM